jgi:hypothetical protein
MLFLNAHDDDDFGGLHRDLFQTNFAMDRRGTGDVTNGLTAAV